MHIKRETGEETDMMKVHGTGCCKVPNLDPAGRDENVLGYGNLVEKSANAAKKYVSWKERQKVWEKQREKMARREEEERKQREEMEETDWEENEDAMLWELLGWQERYEKIRRVTEACTMAKEYRLSENCRKLNEERWENGAMWKLLTEDNYANYLERDREIFARRIVARLEAGTLSVFERMALESTHLTRMQRQAGEAGSVSSNPVLIE